MERDWFDIALEKVADKALEVHLEAEEAAKSAKTLENAVDIAYNLGRALGMKEALQMIVVSHMYAVIGTDEPKH